MQDTPTNLRHDDTNGIKRICAKRYHVDRQLNVQGEYRAHVVNDEVEKYDKQ
jgi:hypothetical protein